MGEIDVLGSSVEALKSFNQHTESVENHIQAYINSIQNITKEDQTFILEVFTGCAHYRKLINVVVEGFINSEGISFHSDADLFAVLTYLVIFRLTELKLSNLKKLISDDIVYKVHRFLKFFLQESNLSSWIKHEWLQLYDSKFVMEEMMQPLALHKKDLNTFVEQIGSKVNFKNKNELKKKSLTKMKPFNLSKCISKPVYFVCKDPEAKKPKRYSLSFLKSEPKEFELFRKTKEENRQKAYLSHLQATKNQFNCAKTETSSKTKAVLQGIIDKNKAKFAFNMKHRTATPNYTELPEPVNLTNSSILREANLFFKKKEKELKSIQDSCFKNRDFTKYDEVNEELDRKENQEKQVQIHKRWIEGKINRQEAILSKQKKIQQNRALAKSMIEESKKKLKESRAELEAKSFRARDLINKIRSNRSNVETVRDKLKNQKQYSAQELNKINSEMLEKSVRDFVKRLREKSVMIYEKHLKENSNLKKQNYFDSTISTVQYGMPLDEAKERVSLEKENRVRLLDEKKDRVLKAKQDKIKALVTAMDIVAAHRRLIYENEERRKIQRDSDSKMIQQEIEINGSLRKLRGKLENITRENLKLMKESEFDSLILSKEENALHKRERKRMHDKRVKEYFDRMEREAMHTPVLTTI